jgi:transcription antitermination factor NusG
MTSASSATLPPPDSTLPEVGDWFVLHAKPRQEKVLAADLAAMSIGCYLPLVDHVRFYGRRKAHVDLPLFPGYLFLRGSLDDAYRADRTRRVAQIIPVNDQAKLHWELANIHLAVSRQAPLDPYPYLTVGTRVEVRAGPFRGLQGVVESRCRAARLVLNIDILGRAVSMEIDGSLLDPVA